MQEESAEEQALQALFHFIETKGLRKTQERETVLRTIYNMKDKVSIEEILSKHQEFFPKIHICRSTVYNCINILLEAHVINELKDKNSTVYCKVFGNRNLIELVCNSCRETQLAELKHIRSLLEHIGCADFQVHNYRVTLYGICAKCKMRMQ